MQHIDERFADFLASVKPYNYCSQFGEDGIIEAIFARIGETNRWLCECRAGDGLFFSNSRKLIEAGWSAVLIEADSKQWETGAHRYLGNPRVYPFLAELNERTGFDEILNSVTREAAPPKDLDLLVCDVDGPDYWLICQMLEYHPRVLMVEYDPNAEPDFIPEPNGPGQAGLAAIIKLGCGKLYTPICRTYCNVIFVRNDLAGILMEAPEDAPESIKMKSVKQGDVVTCNQCPNPVDRAYAWAGAVGKYYCNTCGPAIVGSWRPVEEIERDRIIPQPKDRTPNYLEPLLDSLDRNRASLELTAMPKTTVNAASADNKLVKIAAAMSTPRLGFLSNSDCILAALAQFNIPLARGEGAFWSASLSRSIERCLEHKPDYILTIDYDTAFHSSDIAKLVCFLDDNPGIDAVVPLQMKREGGELLASTDGAADLGQAGIPINQGHFGLTLFRSRVFLDQLALPWFYERPGPDGRWNEGRVDADMGFWKNCRDHGVNVWMHLGVVVGHLELVVTWPDQQLKTHYQSLNGWRDNAMKAPDTAFTRDRIQETIEHSRKLEMKD